MIRLCTEDQIAWVWWLGKSKEWTRINVSKVEVNLQINEAFKVLIHYGEDKPEKIYENDVPIELLDELKHIIDLGNSTADIDMANAISNVRNKYWRPV